MSSIDDSMKASSSSPPLVWVTEGKTQHPALMLLQRHKQAAAVATIPTIGAAAAAAAAGDNNDPDDDPDSSRKSSSSGSSSSSMSSSNSGSVILVQWTSTQQTEWVASDRVQMQLTPRKRGRQQQEPQRASAAAATGTTQAATKADDDGSSITILEAFPKKSITLRPPSGRKRRHPSLQTTAKAKAAKFDNDKETSPSRISNTSRKQARGGGKRGSAAVENRVEKDSEGRAHEAATGQQHDATRKIPRSFIRTTTDNNQQENDDDSDDDLPLLNLLLMESSQKRRPTFGSGDLLRNDHQVESSHDDCDSDDLPLLDLAKTKDQPAEDDSSDDDVEVLFTIRPSPPRPGVTTTRPRPVSRSPLPQPSSSAHPVDSGGDDDRKPPAKTNAAASSAETENPKPPDLLQMDEKYDVWDERDSKPAARKTEDVMYSPLSSTTKSTTPTDRNAITKTWHRSGEIPSSKSVVGDDTSSSSTSTSACDSHGAATAATLPHCNSAFSCERAETLDDDTTSMTQSHFKQGGTKARLSFGASDGSGSVEVTTRTYCTVNAVNSIGNRNVAAVMDAVVDEGMEQNDDEVAVGEPKQYALRTSVYLQNLAEICFTLTQDRRWRVGGGASRHQPLFRWEDGDDLSVVTALSRQFIPRPPPVVVECTCLLCRDEKNPAVAAADQMDPSIESNADGEYADNTAFSSIRQEDQFQHSHQEEGKGHINDSSCIAEPVPGMIEDAAVNRATDPCASAMSVSDDSTSRLIEDNPEVRRLYLYSRLFYRKGPWFRLDDVYNKYYVPKAKATPLQPTDASASAAKPDVASKLNFFQSKSAANPETVTNNKTNSSPIVDKHLLKKHLEEYAPRLIADVYGLHGSGMIRFFNDETECGKTVGMALLNTEERGVILSKLGAGKKRPEARGSKETKENEVWKQMSRQQSIFAAESKDKTASILPVRRHVEAVLLERLAKVIVQACARTDYVPAQVMRAHTLAVKTSIQQLIKEQFHSADTRCEIMCFRLREAPTLVLQRCVRLYLCALSGPGDMRGNGTNGWRSVQLANVKNAPLGRVIPPPGQHTWHQVQYPRLSHCFGLSSACFINAYEPLLVSDAHQLDTDHTSEQVFISVVAFRCWEMCAELRATVDYLVELNESLRSEERRRARGKQPRHGDCGEAAASSSVDLMSLLSENGREVVLQNLLSGIGNISETRAAIERDIQESLSAIDGECEKVLGTIGIIALHILRVCNKSMPVEEQRGLADRPWLRHMSWHACLAYILFDIIPILERRALYMLSVQSLSVLLFGSFHKRVNASLVITEYLHLRETSTLTSLLLSRRARGKAVDRLIIDCGHMHRLNGAAQEKAAKRIASECFQVRVTNFCQQIIVSMAISSSIGFSAIRTLARRLKRPLIETINGATCIESNELGLRFSCSGECSDSKYSDWTAIIDRSVANSLAKDENEPGARCSFIGYEDEDDGRSGSTSLNVEELAMELYRNGRLPVGDESMPLKGGWTGWHDEGGHLRALFRILCSAPVLGMDFGCAYRRISDEHRQDHTTIHLSPYQQAPFDLHVGYEIQKTALDESASAPAPFKGFYCRRADTISTFLLKLENSSDHELSDLVFDSISARLNYMCCSKQKDPFLERDLLQVRTLSAVAAGFGGKQLAAVFRCFFFDYRHYSGGLPDLHLFRAIYDSDPSPVTGRLVDLSSWIGELFSSESQQATAAQRGAALLSDRDDEFLGCSKVGDSGGNASRTGRGGKQLSNTANKLTKTIVPSMNMLPERLRLFHNGCKVKVECMMVEVKSSNDRLDPRQEDWLNVLDRHGHARVCKFEDNRKNKKQQATKASLPQDAAQSRNLEEMRNEHATL